MRRGPRCHCGFFEVEFSDGRASCLNHPCVLGRLAGWAAADRVLGALWDHVVDREGSASAVIERAWDKQLPITKRLARLVLHEQARSDERHVHRPPGSERWSDELWSELHRSVDVAVAIDSQSGADWWQGWGWVPEDPETALRMKETIPGLVDLLGPTWVLWALGQITDVQMLRLHNWGWRQWRGAQKAMRSSAMSWIGGRST